MALFVVERHHERENRMFLHDYEILKEQLIGSQRVLQCPVRIVYRLGNYKQTQKVYHHLGIRQMAVVRGGE